MNGPRRLLEQSGPAARLLRAADTHVPGQRARRLALVSAGSAAATIAASGSSAAAGGGVLLKSALVWLSAGALGGAVVTVAVANVLPSPSRVVPVTASVTAYTPGVRTPLERSASASSSGGERATPTPPLRDDTPTRIPSQRSATPRDTTEPDRLPAASAPSVARSATDERTNPGLYDQLQLIDDARSAAARRDAGAVLALLDQYDRTHPRGQFVPESLALRIETLARTGDRARAQALAARFRRDYPRHPLSTRVTTALGD